MMDHGTELEIRCRILKPKFKPLRFALIRSKLRSIIDAGKVRIEDFPQKVLQILRTTCRLVEILRIGLVKIPSQMEVTPQLNQRLKVDELHSTLCLGPPKVLCPYNSQLHSSSKSLCPKEISWLSCICTPQCTAVNK